MKYFAIYCKSLFLDNLLCCLINDDYNTYSLGGRYIFSDILSLYDNQCLSGLPKIKEEL